MKDADDKLKKLEEKRAKVEAEIKRLRAAASATERKLDTRRKLLAGAVVLAAIDRGELPRAPWMGLLERSLVRPHDRALFDLPPKPDGALVSESPRPPAGSAPKAPSVPPGSSPQSALSSASPRLPQRHPAAARLPGGTFAPRKDTEDI